MNVVNISSCTPTDDEMVVAVNGISISSMMDTGTHRTLLKFSKYRRIDSPAIRSVYHSLYGLGKSQVKPIGVFGTNLTVQGDQYKEEVYVIPDDTMDEKMLLGKGLTMMQMDIRMKGGMFYIRKLEKDDEKKKEEDQEKEKKRKIAMKMTDKHNDKGRMKRKKNLTEIRRSLGT